MYLKLLITFVIFVPMCIGSNTGRNYAISRPNIIYILVDDVGFNDVQWNNPNMNTPFLNQLAKSGVILDQFYAMSLCTPSRTTLMTGLYAQQSGLQRGVLGSQEPYGVPTRFKFIPEILRDRGGYATHAVGKWHLGYCNWKYTPLYRGFDSFFGFYNGAEENYYHCSSNFYIYDPISNCSRFDLKMDNTDVHAEFAGNYSTEIYTNHAVRIINKHPRHKPLFLYIALTDAHFPVQPPPQFRKGCENQPNEARTNFCAAMASTDNAVKNIIVTLKRNKLYDNSVIVFTSDNGGSVDFGGNNYPLRGEKSSSWEGGNRVPAFVHSQLIQNKGRVHNGIFHIVDWYPTFMHLARISPDDSLGLQGVNQWKSISQGAISPRTEFPYLVDIFDGVAVGAVRKGDYKLIISSAGKLNTVVSEDETTDQSFNSNFLSEYAKLKRYSDSNDKSAKLYNLANDPSEELDLADAEPEKVEELKMTFEYYLKISKPAIKRSDDPNGDPDNFNGVFTPGWCKAEFDVPKN